MCCIFVTIVGLPIMFADNVKPVILEDRRCSLHWNLEVQLSFRSDFLQAIIENTHSMSTLNKVVLQQEQNARDANHEITILIGVISAQGRDVKDIKNRVDGFDQRFASIDQRFASFDQRFVSLEGKLEQVLQILTTPPRTDK
jgi:hypothetical protein